MQIDDTHAFSGPKFIVFPQPKREHIRQTLLAATKVPRYGPDFYNFYGLKWLSLFQNPNRKLHDDTPPAV